MRKRGFSLIEIIVATLILSLTMLGLVNIFVASKRLLLHARANMAGGELGKLFLDPLHMEVRQDTWDDTARNALALTATLPTVTYCDANHPSDQNLACPPDPAARMVNGVVYSASYGVSEPLANSDIRKVVLSIYWPRQ